MCTLKSEIILETAEYVSSVSAFILLRSPGMDSLGEVLTNIAFQSLFGVLALANATSG
jgi:hypothetical protein